MFNPVEFKAQQDAAVVLANAGEVVASVISEIAGNDISNSLNGEKLTTGLIQTMAYQTILKSI